MNTNPRIGWTRTNEAIGTGVTNELSRLSTENSNLRNDLNMLQKKQEEQSDEVRGVVNIMNENSRSYKVRETSNWNEAERYEVDLLSAFQFIAPIPIDENSSIGIARNLALGFVGATYHRNWPIGKNLTAQLIADYVALEVIEKSKKKHSLQDKDSYWRLTKLGREVQKRGRRIQLEEGIRTSEENEQEETKQEESSKKTGKVKTSKKKNSKDKTVKKKTSKKRN